MEKKYTVKNLIFLMSTLHEISWKCHIYWLANI